VQILSDSVDIAVGQTARLTFRLTDSTGAIIEGEGADSSAVPVLWSSSRPSIATVDSLGLVSAAAIGQSAIVLSVGDKTDTALVNVVASPVAQVVLNAPPQFSISVGSSYQIAATARDAAGNDLPGRAFAWSSSDPTVASVSQTGVITGIASGSAQITVLSEGQTAHANVIVSPPSVASVNVSLASEVINTGQMTQATAVVRDPKGNTLTGRSVVWSSRSFATATVSNSGIVKGIARGMAAITAVVDGVEGSATIQVESASTPTVASITVSITPSSIAVGQTGQAVATIRDSAGRILTDRPLTWSSSDTRIATVSGSGVITAVSAGSVVIQSTVDGVSGQTSLNVSVPSVIPAPAPTPGTLVSHDFEDGTLGGYFNPWGAGIDVVSDPTGGGHGKVARIRYTADGVTQLDDNKAIAPKANFALGLGDSVWFRGDFYLPATVEDSTNYIRKLTYWGKGTAFHEGFDMVIVLVGNELVVSSIAVGPSSLAHDVTYTPTSVSKGQWHRLEVQLKVNSSFTAQDGILRIWLDGASVYARTDMRWTDPLWTEDPSTYKWDFWGVGYQMQESGVPYDEYRYWDNVAFAKTRITP
jgi:uncharacterized protein YjdB